MEETHTDPLMLMDMWVTTGLNASHWEWEDEYIMELGAEWEIQSL